jgi:hypothetical protein
MGSTDNVFLLWCPVYQYMDLLPAHYGCDILHIHWDILVISQ